MLETNMTEIMTRIEEQNKIEKEEVCFIHAISYVLYPFFNLINIDLVTYPI